MGSRAGVIKIAAARAGVPCEEYLANVAAGLKFCWKCRGWRLREFFNIDRSRGDGLASRCVGCTRVADRRRRKLKGPTKVEQQRAVDAVRYAVRMGRMAPVTTLPCLDCGAGARVYHHHRGYGRAHLLDVQPLCHKCHQRRHWKGESHG